MEAEPAKPLQSLLPSWWRLPVGYASTTSVARGGVKSCGDTCLPRCLLCPAGLLAVGLPLTSMLHITCNSGGRGWGLAREARICRVGSPGSQGDIWGPYRVSLQA